MSYLSVYDIDRDVFFADQLGVFEIDGVRHCGLLSFVGRKSSMDRFLVGADKGVSFYTDNRRIETFPKGYRLFRQHLGRNYLRSLLVPSGLIVREDATDDESAQTPKPGEPPKKETPLDRLLQYPPIRTAFVTLDPDRSILAQRLVHISPIPLLPEWSHEILTWLQHTDDLNDLRIQSGMPAVPGQRIAWLALSGPSANPFWGAYLNVQVSDLAVITAHLLDTGVLSLSIAA